MITTRLQDLGRAIEEGASRGRQAGRLDEFRTRADQLHARTEKLKVAVDGIEILKDLDTGHVDVSESKLEDLAGKLAELSLKFRESPDVVLKRDQFDVVGLLAGLDALARDVDSQRHSIWQQFTNRYTALAGGDLTTLLEAIPELQPSIQVLRSVASELSDRAGTPPETADDLERVRESARKFDDAWTEIKNADVPPEIRTFLEAAGSSDGAPLELLTESVRDWLADHAMLPLFRIRFGSHRSTPE